MMQERGFWTKKIRFDCGRFRRRKGLSKALYRQTIPSKNTSANLNIDMIGRIGDFHTHPNYVYLIGSDMLTDLHNLSEEVNAKHTKLELDYANWKRPK